MSILLEALKKSERQRRLGQTPTLETGVEAASAMPGGINHWLPIALLVMSAAAMGWFSWQQMRPPESREVSDAAEVAGAPAEQGSEVRPSQLASPSGSRSRTPTEEFRAESQVERERKPPATPRPRADRRERSRLAQSFNNYKSDAAKPGQAAPSAAPVESNRRQASSATEAELAEARSGEAVAQSTEQEAQPRQSRMEKHIPEPISFWELPQGVRDSLPEIRITVLVYADRPEDRFLLTNGQRLAEKDELESGLVLDEIRRDGAVFLYRKYRFLVKG